MTDKAYVDYYNGTWHAWHESEGRKWTIKLPPVCIRNQAAACLRKQKFEPIFISDQETEENQS